MIRMVSSRVKTASEAYDAIRRIGVRVKRANPKDEDESASSVEKNVSEGSFSRESRTYDVGEIQRHKLSLHRAGLKAGAVASAPRN